MTSPNVAFKVFRIIRNADLIIKQGSGERPWMECTSGGFANRCLPMRIASQACWTLILTRSIRAKWLGGNAPKDVIVTSEGDEPSSAISHFGEGILTFTLPYLFRTPPGISLLLRGPPNTPKDAIAPLEGIVETEWSVAGTSINWKFTRSQTEVTFSAGEAVGAIVPVQLGLLESMEPTLSELSANSELEVQFDAWRASMASFNQRLSNREASAVSEGWQRYYMRGGAPHAGSSVIAGRGAHRTKLSLRGLSTPDK